MHHLRRLALNHGRLAALLFALALLAKILVPAGYMPTSTGKTLTVAMCNGSGPVTINIPMSDTKGSHTESNDHPCIFSMLGGPCLAAADLVLLAAAIAFAFVFALFARQIPPLERDRHLRPPLRGPPAFA